MTSTNTPSADGVVDAEVHDWAPEADDFERAARVVEHLAGDEAVTAVMLRREAADAREAAEFEHRIATVAADAWGRAGGRPFDTLGAFSRRAIVVAAKAGYAEAVVDQAEKAGA